MNFQIKKLILWPKKTGLRYKEIEFELGAINIITGASRTGKSAVIPIIDYCLASDSCYIPVKTIRNACSWFGVLIHTNNTDMLLARREPGIQKTTDDMYFIEGESISIPDEPVKNNTAKNVKKHLDEFAQLTFLDIEPDSNNKFYGRPSFRDLMAFCFQPQNIMANANTLFYKADTTEHRTKLINIFPYILGAVTPDILAKRQEIDELFKELKRKERDLSKIKDVAQKWKIELSGWIAAAQEYGLIFNNNINILSFEEQVELLSSLANKKASDSNILNKNIVDSSQEIVALRNEENDISFKLSSFKHRFTEMTQLMKSIDDYRESLAIQIERLNICKWLMKLTENDCTCPICGKSDSSSKEQLGKFYFGLSKLEEESGYTNKIPAAFEREYESVKTEIDKLTEQLNAIQKRIKIQTDIRDSSEEEKYTIENIARFLGQAQYAAETFETLGTDSELLAEINRLTERLKELRAQVNESAILQRINTALRTIEAYTIKLIPMLDSERPNDPLQIDYHNLTVIVSGDDGRDDYLWEIGSGSNWLAYHISVTLGFHLFFNKQVYSSVPNFIVYDQPSQVYFPQKLAAKDDEKELDPKLEKDEDQIAVRKIFTTMSEALNISNNGFQIIVLEHADSSIWGDVDKVHEVCEWRGENNKLVPEEWK